MAGVAGIEPAIFPLTADCFSTQLYPISIQFIECKPPESDLNGRPPVLQTGALTQLSYRGKYVRSLKRITNNENGRSRTCNLQLRKLTRYPITLRSQNQKTSWRKTVDSNHKLCSPICLANSARPLTRLLSLFGRFTTTQRVGWESNSQC